MQDKRFKLIYFSTGDSDVREYSLGWKKLVLYFSGFLVVCLCFLIGVISLFTNAFHNVNVVELKKTNSQLKHLLAEMERKVGTIEKNVNYIKKTDRDLRVFYDMTDYSEDERKLGRGGLESDGFSVYGHSTDEALNNATRMNKLLTELDKRIDFAKQSREEISSVKDDSTTRWKRIPSINPVPSGRFTDLYGWRIHPLTAQKQFHEGLDISANRGTPVFAPADGIVKVALSRYKPNQSYGKQVVIDHGNGFRTVFAHLKNVDVSEGQEIERFGKIGTVGDTGRATGPHLHYEVHKDGSTLNPMDYILVFE